MHVPRARDISIAGGAITLAALWSALGLLGAGWALVGPGQDPALWAAVDLGRIAMVALPLAVASYLLRFLRWHRLASRVAPGLELSRSFLDQAAGFGMTVTPARLGEIVKFHLLERQTRVPIARSVPIILVEKLTEGAGFLLLALGAGIALGWPDQVAGRFGWLAAGLAAVAVAAMALGAAPLRARLLSRVGRLTAGWSRAAAARQFLAGSWRVLGARPLTEALLATLASRLCDGMVLYAVARSMGVDLPVAAAIFALGAAGTVGGLSMLPAGVGAVEASMTGLLIAFGAPASLALGATLLTRALILWLWVAFGLAVIVAWPSLQRGRP